MKKIYIFLTLIVCALALNLFLFWHPIHLTQPSTLYAKPATIIAIENDIVTVEDSHGYLWTFYGSENRAINDKVVCIMSTRNTSTIFDDEIVNVTFEQ